MDYCFGKMDFSTQNGGFYEEANLSYSKPSCRSKCRRCWGNNKRALKFEEKFGEKELKIFNNFEAIVLIPRMMPFKTKLLPDYQIDYGYESIKMDIPSRNTNKIRVFDIKTIL